MPYLLNFLPWLAAISAAALAAAGIPALLFGGQFAGAFPYALGACAVVGIPIALRYRAGWGWTRAFFVLVGSVVAIGLATLAIDFGKLGGEAQGWVLAITFSYGLLALMVAIPALIGGALVALPAGWLVLRLSGEWRAIAEGKSIYDLPHRSLRAVLLLVVALFPIGPYTLVSGKEQLEAACKLPARYPLDRKAEVYLDVDKPDWPELRRVLEKAAATQDLRVVAGDSTDFRRGQPSEYGLCMPGRVAFGVATSIDVGSPMFEPRGDEYVTITPYAANGEPWEAALRNLMAAVDERWPGIKVATNLDLGPSLRPQKIDRGACRTKSASVWYRKCLGSPGQARREMVYLHAPTGDLAQLRAVMKEFAESRGTALAAEGGLCEAGKMQIVWGEAREVPITVVGQRFHAQLVATYVPAPDTEAELDQLVAVLEREWPGVVRSRPDPDFCRVLKARR
jgi:hypothetical protein